MKNPGIHIRLLLAAFLVIGATTLTLGYVGIGITHKFVQSRFDERMQFLAKYLGLNAELGILIDDGEMLERLAQNLLSEKDVARVMIFDRGGKILADMTRENSDELSHIEIPVMLKESPDVFMSFQRGSEEKKIGSVKISYSTAGINQMLLTIKRRFIWLSAGLAFLSVFLFFFLSRSLVAPVTDLVKAVQKVAEGNLEFRVKPGNLPETRNLSLAFNAMLDSLEKSRKALDEANREMIRQNTLAEIGKFSMTVAHEVKNPLGIIKSSVDILKKEIRQPSGKTMISYIEDEIRRLNRLIEDFLLFARPVRPNFRLVDANTMLNESLVRFDIRLSGQAVEIRSSIPPHPFEITADPDVLHRAVDNLMKNALEAGGQKGIIHVEATNEPDRWEVAVRDEGKGIAPEHMEKIFEPFFTTRAKGTGLGLAFVQQAAASHGGTVSVANHPDGGAVFRMEIPVFLKNPFLNYTA